jgi:hypothetical protein
LSQERSRSRVTRPAVRRSASPHDGGGDLERHRRRLDGLGYAYSYGAADRYTGLNGGPTNASLPNPTNATPAPAYAPATGTLDGGLAVFNSDGTLHLIQWQSYLFGLQYYLPALNGRAWISANYSHLSSNNAKQHGAAAKIRDHEDWFDVNLFGDVTPAVRLGLEYSFFRDAYVDGNTPVNHRVQLSVFYLF